MEAIKIQDKTTGNRGRVVAFTFATNDLTQAIVVWDSGKITEENLWDIEEI